MLCRFAFVMLSGVLAAAATRISTPALHPTTNQGTHVSCVADTKALTSEGARMVLDAALAECHRNKVGGSIAVVDSGGHLVAFQRLDGTGPATWQISIGKARTAALFKKPTKFFEDWIRDGRTSMVTLPDGFTPLQGGVPIVVDGVHVGGIGVSGAASAEQDEQVAIVGAEAAGMHVSSQAVR